MRILDSLTPQVHGAERKRPSYLDPHVELVIGDIRDPDTVRSALRGVDAVYHLAAWVGVGPRVEATMSEIAECTSVNNLGTAVLLEALIANPVRRLIVASSVSIYGEGLYLDEQDNPYEHVQRDAEQLMRCDWDPRSSNGSVLIPIPTPETKAPTLGSIYALSKYDQERMCMLIGTAYQIPTVALRFFNVYGPRQALSNPYTGVLTTYAARCLHGKPPLICEDGRQRRDFVHVHDVAVGCRLALEVTGAAGGVFNLASGMALTLRAIADRTGSALGKPIEPRTTDQHRAGEIRHCLADLRLARRVLGYTPRIDLETGLCDLASWLTTHAAIDRIADMGTELADRCQVH